ncbi:polyunsaturated fatty acid 5-lipoxygenase isoform X2 [Hydra vulgaris]|uniref:Polyunsaturated fatty acid 5-lipoxygenase isoform X2 n=1 Tax=Hydra vulgaris TaxID=6087 RepID=A0ABM4CYX1_HYDVU
MGTTPSRNKIDFEIVIKTGDVKGAGTDSNVYCCLIDCKGNKSRDLLLDVKWRNDFEKGSIDLFKIRNVPNIGKLESIELWRDDKGINDDWYLEYAQVKQITGVLANDLVNESILCNGFRYPKSNKNVNDNIFKNFLLPFPCHRWIKANKKYVLYAYDSLLPQFDPRTEQRKEELEDKKNKYAFSESSAGMPRRVANCPREENFSNDYKWDILGRKIKLLAQSKLTRLLTSDKWNSLDNFLHIYKGTFDIPHGYYNWDSDVKFGEQRLRGCNPTLIQLCTKVPDNFAVSNEMVGPFLDGSTFDMAIEKKEIFWVNLGFLDNLCCKNARKICSPMALFHAKKNGDLIPIAIQLFQEPSSINPVFLPSDPPYTWMLAKMYFNNADCAVHQSCTHLGFTHLVCESACVTVHQTLSPSHPVYRLLAPHFLYLIAINSLAVEKLLAPDGWIDITMTMGVCGLMEILKRKWINWRLDRDGWLPNDIKNRGVGDTTILKNYMYRDDGLLIHEVILKYVTEVLTTVYDTPEKLKEDYEIQNWAFCLTDEANGAGIKGVFGNGKFEELEDLIKTVSSVIFLGSVGHASANFCQYDEYAFPPNYPAIMNGEVPTSKAPYTLEDVIAQLPDKQTTLNIMVVTKILSDRGTNPLGDFEVQYQYNPDAIAAVQRFRRNLADVSFKIKERNKGLKNPYPYLDPEEVPNAISI